MRVVVYKELLDARTGIADDIHRLIYARLGAAVPIETLSDRDDKLLQVVQERNGQKFVTRRFTNEAVTSVEAHGLNFNEAWEAMKSKFSETGISIVPSQLLTTDGAFPFTVISEYLEKGRPLETACLATKMRLADNLGKLLRGRYMPHPQMLHPDTFIVDRTEDGSEDSILIDVDPLMLTRPIVSNAERFPSRMFDLQKLDGLDAFFIRQLTELFEQHWCKEDEKRAALSTLAASLKTHLNRTGEFESQTGQAYMDLLLKASVAGF